MNFHLWAEGSAEMPKNPAVIVHGPGQVEETANVENLPVVDVLVKAQNYATILEAVLACVRITIRESGPYARTYTGLSFSGMWRPTKGGYMSFQAGPDGELQSDVSPINIWNNWVSGRMELTDAQKSTQHDRTFQNTDTGGNSPKKPVSGDEAGNFEAPVDEEIQTVTIGGKKWQITFRKI